MLSKEEADQTRPEEQVSREGGRGLGCLINYIEYVLKNVDISQTLEVQN